MSAKKAHKLDFAEATAKGIVALLEDACERIQIAGSIRRRKAYVGDIEILAIPKTLPLRDMFQHECGRIDLLDARLSALITHNEFSLRPSKTGVTTYGPKNKLLIHTTSGIGVDVFSTTPEFWGMALFVRTGPAAWNKRAFQRLTNRGLQGHAYGGVTDRYGRERPCPDETTVFRFLDVEYIEPHRRM